MRALVLEDFHRLVVAQIPEPSPAPDEVLIDVVATAICGSDFHGYTGENGRRIPGQIMGHESVGRVAHDPGGTFEPGTVVTFNPMISCGHCAACEAGQQQHCAQRRVIGVDPTIVAAFAERIVVPAANVVPLSADIPVLFGALIEPLAVALHAVRRGAVGPEDSVLVMGGGPIGQSVILAARRAGAAQVVVSEPDPARRALCERLGALALDPAAGDVREQLIARTGALATVAIDAVGISPTIASALAATRFGATVVLVGMGSPSVEVPAFAVSTEERVLVGSFCYSNDHFREAATWMDEGDAIFAELITREVGIDGADAAFAGLAAGDGTAGKVLVRFAD
jgi:threonine dehydrogenase-like Zn-dependent dehydrogenase